MSAINDIEIRPSEINGTSADFIKGVIAARLWAWFVEHENDSLKLKFWIFNGSVKYRVLRPFVIALLGPISIV